MTCCQVQIPVRIISDIHALLVPISNERYLAERIPGSQLTILDTGHFASEQVPDQPRRHRGGTGVARAEAQAGNPVI